MTIKRYAVIDADGFKVNTILIDDTKLEGYYPGYGAKLIDEGIEPEEPKAPRPPPPPADFGVLDVKPSQPMDTGDKIDFVTGEVTKKKPDPIDPVDPGGVLVDPAVIVDVG